MGDSFSWTACTEPFLTTMTHFLSIILLAVLPFQFAIPFLTFGDIPIARLLAAVILASFLVEALSRRSFRLPSLVFSGTLISFLLLAAASIIWAAHPDVAVPKAVFLLNLLPLVFVWYDTSKRRTGGLELLIRAMFFGATGAAFTAIIFFLSQFIFGVGPTFHFIVDRILPFFLGHEFAGLVAQYPSLMVNLGGETVLRATAVFPDPHVAAYFFGLSGFLALGMLRMTGRPGYLSIAMIIFLADLLTFSRGGAIGLLVGGLAYFALSNPEIFSLEKNRLRLAVFVGVLFLVFLSPPVLSRFLTSFSFSDTSSTERIALWKEAVGAIGESPVLGVGLGNYLATARPLYAPETPFYAHNLYLDVATETGLVGLALFLTLFVWSAAKILCLRRSTPWAAPIGGALTLYLAHSLVETALFSLHVTVLLALLFAITLSLERRPA